MSLSRRSAADSTDPRDLIKARDVAAVFQLAQLISLCAHKPAAFRFVLPALREAAAGLKDRYVDGFLRLDEGLRTLLDEGHAALPAPLPALSVEIPNRDVYHKLEALAAGTLSDKTGDTSVFRDPKVRLLRDVLRSTILRTMQERAFVLRRLGAGAELSERLDVSGLSPREIAVAREFIAGHSKRGIADSLGLSIETVRTYIDRLYAKVCVSSREELIDTLRAREDRDRSDSSIRF